MNALARLQFYLLIAFVPFAAPLVFLFRRRVRTRERRFLVIPQLTRIGDIVCATPVFRAIKEAEQGSYLAVLTSISQNAAGIIANNPRIDSLVIYEEYHSHLFALIRALRRERFDVGISLSGTALSSVLMYYAGIPVRVKIVRRGRPLIEWLTDVLTPERFLYNNHRFLPQFWVDMLRACGINAGPPVKEVFTTPETDREADGVMRACGIVPGDMLVGVSVSAGNRVKEWGDGKFEFLARSILTAYPRAKILFFGPSRDAARIDAIMKNMKSERVFAFTDGSLEGLPSLMKKFSLFVSVDSGPMHVADALGVPLIDILGPVCRGELTPDGAHAIAVEPDPPVDPSVFSFDRPGDPFLTKLALENTSVERVFDAVKKLLKN